MADCEFDPALLQDFLDGRLDGPARHRVADHLADCRACSKVYAGYVALDALLGGLPAADPSPLLADRVLLAIDCEREAAVEPRELAKSVAAVIAVLGAGALVFAGSAAAPGDERFAWLWALAQYVTETAAQMFSGLASLAEGWGAMPTASLTQTFLLLLAFGAAAATTNHFALKRGT